MIHARLPGAAFAALLLLVLAYVAWKGLGTPGVAGLFPAVVGVVGTIAALVNLLQVLRGKDAGAEDAATAGADAAWLAGLLFASSRRVIASHIFCFAVWCCRRYSTPDSG